MKNEIFLSVIIIGTLTALIYTSDKRKYKEAGPWWNEEAKIFNPRTYGPQMKPIEEIDYTSYMGQSVPVADILMIKKKHGYFVF